MAMSGPGGVVPTSGVVPGSMSQVGDVDLLASNFNNQLSLETLAFSALQDTMEDILVILVALDWPRQMLYYVMAWFKGSIRSSVQGSKYQPASQSLALTA